ncbi:MAG: hypothetical protein H6738_12390 [Alphaproteobacteria bacterium]|nr:hypothetical protein [Alphaproteobacteria bacterium]
MTTRGSLLLVGVVLVALVVAWFSMPAPGTSAPRPRPEVVTAPSAPASAPATVPTVAPAARPRAASTATPGAPEVIPVPGLPFKGVVAVPGGIAPPRDRLPGVVAVPSENDAGWEALQNGEPYADPDWFPEGTDTEE